MALKTYQERLKELREDNDKNQTQVASYLGIRQTVYSRYEVGRNLMPLHHLIALADYYQTSTDYILGLTNERKPYPRATITKQ